MLSSYVDDASSSQLPASGSWIQLCRRFGSRVLRRAPPLATNKRRSLGRRVGGEGAIRTLSKPGGGEQLAHLVVAEAEPDVAHLLAVLLAIVRQHVADQEPPARPQHARRFASAAPGSGTWCSTSISVAASSDCVVDAAAPRARRGARRRCRSRAAGAAPPAACRRERSTAITLRHERRQRGGDLAGAAPEVADRQRVVQQPGQGLEVRGRRRTSRRAGDPTGRPPKRRTPATRSAASPARP